VYNLMGDDMKTYLLHADTTREISISDISISDEDYNAGNPYNTTLSVKIKSGEFTGRGSFELDIADFCTFAKELFGLYTNLSGKVLLRDIGYGSLMDFEAVDKIRHIQISGEIFGYASVHSVKFEFRVDQTELRLFCKRLFDDFGALEKYKHKAKYNGS